MGLSAGAKLGPYEILSVLGSGGMGEVFRARDTKLNREVAVKVLLPSVADNPDRLARFSREAQVLASLNHANIAQVFGLEESGGVRALVMELVEGPTLADRIQQGPVPLEEALLIATQIADALEAAHEHGVVHRDLKPANIKVTRDDVVKVLDFGLAITDERAAAAAASGSSSDSPTMSRHMTEAGMILGTAAYMSPEQARGKRADKRADIWAFGVVLFEMLCGKRLFEGETVSDTLAAVLMREPDWKSLPPSVPPHVRRVLRRCLERDPKKRLRDIGDARLALQEPQDPEDAPVGSATNKIGTWRRALPWAVAALAIALATGEFIVGRGGRSAEVSHLDVAYPADVEPVFGLAAEFSLAPDGRTVAMIGVRDGVRKLFIRHLDRPDAIEVNDSTGVTSVAFSRDSKSVAFIPGRGVVTVLSLANQERSSIANGADLNGSVAWTSNEILYNKGGELWAAPIRGGAPRQLTRLDESRHEVLHKNPIVLPDERTVLFDSATSTEGQDRIYAVSIDGKSRSVVLEHAVTPAWSPTGHLVFGRDGALWAVKFNPSTAQTNGEPVQVAPAGVISPVPSGGLAFSIADNGSLVFVPSDFENRRLIAVNHDGAELTLNLPAARYGNPRVSPDGHRVLVESGANAIQVIDLVRGTSERLTAAATATSFATWTADGKGVVFRRFNVPFWAAADGSGRTGALASGLINDFPSAPGPDPDTILDVRIQPETSGDVYLMSTTGKFAPKPLIATPAYEGGPQLSPDGRWLLYQSNESGRSEVYVRPYPALDRHWQASEGGGVQTRWSPNGREIYYRNGQSMMAVSFNGSAAEPTFGKPTTLFEDRYDFGQGISIPNYDVMPDGRFVMLRRASSGNTLLLILNWTEELKRLIASGGIR